VIQWEANCGNGEVSCFRLVQTFTRGRW
jgi:hypothetical protein